MRSPIRALVAAAAAAVATVSVGGAVGLWPVGAPATPQAEDAAQQAGQHAAQRVSEAGTEEMQPVLTLMSAATRDVEGVLNAVRQQHPGSASAFKGARVHGDSTAVPRQSGTGRRVVFDMSAQRVWLVRADDTALRTYPVSGSRLDNLSPGTYEVYSASRHATSYTYDETMQYMVRFTRGENAAIGFHDIPVDHDGDPVQSVDQLGEPLSSGCIRQRRRDAKALWDFAPEGTRVVVVA